MLFINSYTYEHGDVAATIKMLIKKLFAGFVVDAFSNYRCVADHCKH